MSFDKHNALVIVGKKFIDETTDQGVYGVLAHEFGHIKHKHILKTMVAMSGLSIALGYFWRHYFPPHEININAYTYQIIQKNMSQKELLTKINANLLLLILMILTRIHEEQADNAAIITGGPENFVTAMEELDCYVRDDFKTYKKEYAFLQKKVAELQVKSPNNTSDSF